MRRVKGTAYAAIGAVAVTLGSWQVAPTVAMADPEPQPQLETPAPELLHNVVYRARVDGMSRGARITYLGEGNQLQTAEPTMVPGRVFEANTVLPASEIANLRVSIEWPYSANLHCEILVDDTLVAQADDFVGPRVRPQRDDPNFGALNCQTPVSGIANSIPENPDSAPIEGQPPVEPVVSLDASLPPVAAPLPPL